MHYLRSVRIVLAVVIPRVQGSVCTCSVLGFFFVKERYFHLSVLLIACFVGQTSPVLPLPKKINCERNSFISGVIYMEVA